MKKRIAIFVVLAMVLCLALTGCGQSDKKGENVGAVEDGVGAGDTVNSEVGDNFDTGDWVIMDGSNNSGDDLGDYKDATNGNDESIPDGGAWNEAQGGGSSGSIDNANPKQDASGMYIYEVRGHEVKLSFNIWDYIGTEKTANYFKLITLANYFGYDEKYNFDGLWMNKHDDGSLVYVGFQHHTEGTTDIYVGTNTGLKTAVTYNFYDYDSMEYVYDNPHKPISFEFILLCAYAIEYNSDGIKNDTFDSILEDYRRDDGYVFVLPSPEQ